MEPSLAEEYGLLKAFFQFSDPYGRYGQFYGVPDRSTPAVTGT